MIIRLVIIITYRSEVNRQEHIRVEEAEEQLHPRGRGVGAGGVLIGIPRSEQMLANYYNVSILNRNLESIDFVII